MKRCLVLAAVAALGLASLSADAQPRRKARAPRAAVAAPAAPGVDAVLGAAFDVLGLGRLVGMSYGQAKERLTSLLKDGGSALKTLGENLHKGVSSLQKGVEEKLRAAMSPEALIDGAFDAGMKGLEIVGKIASIPDQIQAEVNAFFAEHPIHDLGDKKHDESIKRFFRDKFVHFYDRIVKGGGPALKVVMVLHPELFLLSQGIRLLGTKIVPEQALPFVKLVLFVRTKLKSLVELLMMGVLRGAAFVNRVLEGKAAGLPPTVQALARAVSNLPRWVKKLIVDGADLLGRTVGSVGTYVLELNPTVKQVVKDVVNALSNAAGAMSTALDSFQDVGAALSGDPDVLRARAASLAKAGVKLPPAGNPQFRSALAEHARKRLGAALTPPGGKLRAEIQRVCAAVRLAKAKRQEWRPTGRIADEEAIAKVCRGMQGLLKAVGDAVVALITPALNQLAALINMKLAAEVGTLVQKGITFVLKLIPEAGGIIGGIFNAVSGVFVRILLDQAASTVIRLGAEQVRFEILDFDSFFASLWLGTKDQQQMMEDVGGLFAKFKDFFEAARKGLGGLNEGLQKGAAAMLEGPIMQMVLSKLPAGLGPVLIAPLQGALEEAFKPGKLNLNVHDIVRGVLRRLREPLKKFLLGNLQGAGKSARFTRLVTAVGEGVDAAWKKAVETEPFRLERFLTANPIRVLLAELLEAAGPKLASFLVDELSLAAGANKGLLCGLEELLHNAIRALVPIVRDGGKLDELVRGGVKSLVATVVRVAAAAPEGNKGALGPLGQFLSCNIRNERFKRMLIPALNTAAGFFAREENIDRLMKGGVAGVLGVLLKVAAEPIAVLAAEGLKDPLLEREVAGAISSVGDDVLKEGFLRGLKAGGVRGALVWVATRAKEPVVAWLSRRFGDPEFAAALRPSYDGVVAELGRKGKLTDAAFKAILEAFAMPWARFAFRKAMDLLKTSVPAAKAQLATMVSGIVVAVPPDIAAAIRGAAGAVIEGLGEGSKAFAEKAKSECGTDAVIRDVSKATLERLFSCLKTAAKVGAATGVRVALVGAIEAFGESLQAGIRRLNELMQRIPALGGLGEVIRLASSAGAEAGKARFVERARPCPGAIGDDALDKASATAKKVVLCIVAAAKSALRAGATAAAKQALLTALERFKARVSEGQEALVGFINRFQLGDLKPVADLKAVLGEAVKAGGSAGNERFYEEGVKCADRVSEETWTSGAKLKGAFAAVATCLWQAAKSALREGATAATKQALLTALERFKARVSEGQEALVGFINRFQLGGLKPVADLKAVLGEAVKAGGDAGNERFYEEGVKCADRVSEDSWTEGRLKSTFKDVATCLWAAAKSAFRAGATAALRTALFGAIEAFSRTLREGRERLQALVVRQRTQVPALDRLKSVAAIAAGQVAEAGRARFVRLARRCPQRFTEAGMTNPTRFRSEARRVVACIGGAAESAFRASAETLRAAFAAALSDLAKSATAGVARLQALARELGKRFPSARQLADLAKRVAAAAPAELARFREQASACLSRLDPRIGVAQLAPALDAAVGCWIERAKAAFENP